MLKHNGNSISWTNWSGFFWFSSFFRALYIWWGHSNPQHHYGSGTNAGNESCAALTFLCQPTLDGWTTELLPKPTSSARFSACRVLDFSFQCCTLCCAKPVPVLPPRLPISQCFSPSSPGAFIICGSVIHRLCKSEILNSPTKHLGQKAAVSGNPVWKLCQNQWRSSSLGPGHCFLQGTLNRGQNGASC